MRISDWSSDVCLPIFREERVREQVFARELLHRVLRAVALEHLRALQPLEILAQLRHDLHGPRPLADAEQRADESLERVVGMRHQIGEASCRESVWPSR